VARQNDLVPDLTALPLLNMAPIKQSHCKRLLLLRPLAVIVALLGIVSAYTELSDEALRAIPSAGPDFDIKTGALLAPLLIPRIAGTDGSVAAQNHFLDFFRTQLPEWKVDIHNSSSTTPATGNRQIPFANLIFRRDPPWAKEGDVGRLTLVAHYDSLFKPADFIGATDSAAPCAMLMHAARSIEAALVKKWSALQASGEAGSGLESEVGVQILLLDGEEAFESWSSTDSLYGSRYAVMLSLPPLSVEASTHPMSGH
jgi:glutaminyl-peptide cyclotransferase